MGWKAGKQHGFARLVGVEMNLGQEATQKARWAKSHTVLCPSHRLGTILSKAREMEKATHPGE